MTAAVRGHYNQYARDEGNIGLCKEIARVYGEKMGRDLNPATEIMVTNGAMGALFSTIRAYV
jgi:kynurenine--oxoglutarate transaminase/cysteine-S-conjugate beta-lyase/glutamine--phenylpyruvate transaminase